MEGQYSAGVGNGNGSGMVPGGPGASAAPMQSGLPSFEGGPSAGPPPPQGSYSNQPQHPYGGVAAHPQPHAPPSYQGPPQPQSFNNQAQAGGQGTYAAAPYGSAQQQYQHPPQHQYQPQQHYAPSPYGQAGGGGGTAAGQSSEMAALQAQLAQMKQDQEEAERRRQEKEMGELKMKLQILEATQRNQPTQAPTIINNNNVSNNNNNNNNNNINNNTVVGGGVMPVGVMAPPVVMVPTFSTSFQTSFWGCCDDSSSCIGSFFFPCVQYGLNREAMGANASCAQPCMEYCAWCMVLGVFGSGYVNMSHRQTMRGFYNIRTGDLADSCCDCLLGCICQPCSLSHVARELKSRIPQRRYMMAAAPAPVIMPSVVYRY